MMAVRRGRRRRERLGGVLVIMVVTLGVTLMLQSGRADGDTGDDTGTDTFTGRKLLADDISQPNCTPRSVNQFPGDFMTTEQKKHGGVIVHILIALYIFAALAIVCDDYFVPALEKISDALHLQADVAGATFMAAGSSAPELFTSIIGVFFAKSDVGLGTILGSAVFNILFILALCGLFGGMVIYLTWWPMFRDTVFYLLSVIVLTLVILDNKITWYESLAMLLLYIIYILVMYFNPVIGDYLIAKVNNLKERWNFRQTSDGQLKIEEKSPLLGYNPELIVSYKDSDQTSVKQRDADNLLHVEDARSRSGSKYSENIGFEHHSHMSASVHESGEYESPFTMPQSLPKRVFWFLMLPVSCLMCLTIPDCRRPGCWQKTFVISFLMSIIWIAGLSYVMVWMVVIAGNTFNIPDAVMGLTFLAAGTSVPDAMASVLVARDGYGDMAVSNSIGSNIFDILICLGLPWLIETSAIANVDIQSNSIAFTAVTLFGTVLFLLVSMLINGWKLNKKFAVICLVVYVVVTTIACLFETNVFMDVNPPPCP